MATGGGRITGRGSYQGIWVLSPGGDLLGRCNTRNADRVLEVLASAMENWAELPDKRRRLADDGGHRPRHRWEDNYPEGGLVLERVARDATFAEGQWEPTDRWNRDFAWFRAEELTESVPAELAVGTRFELPLVAGRLARFHLVDNARGQALPFAQEEVEAQLTAEVVSRDGDQVELVLRGNSLAASEGTWRLGPGDWKPKVEIPHGVQTVLAGGARWNASESRFEELELVALGRHWGRTANNGRGRDSAPGPIVFHLEQVRGDRRIAPTFVDVYDADWIVRPAVPTWVESPEECGLEVE